MVDTPDPQFEVGVSSGIYMAARSPEMGSIVRKLGFALTRGTKAIELAGDVPHEIDYTQGKEIRYIAEKQDLTLLFHGSLTVPLAMPERGAWRDAQDHLEKSIRSAVMGGCKYVNFHACLNYWLELMTYAGRKLTLSFVDHRGIFVQEIFSENPRLREWFVDRKYGVYGGDVLYQDEYLIAQTGAEAETETERRQIVEQVKKLIDDPVITNEIREDYQKEIDQDLRQTSDNRRFIVTPELLERRKVLLIERLLTTNIVSGFRDKTNKTIQTKVDSIRHTEIPKFSSVMRKNKFQDKMRGKLSDAKAKWDSEELRAVVGVIDGYHIMAHYLYYKNDPIWQKMADVYPQVIKKYERVTYHRPTGDALNEIPSVACVYGPGNKDSTVKDETFYWLDAAWEEAERENDREFKEFFYAVCAAKFMEGHLEETFKWMNSPKPDGLIGFINREAEKDEKEKLLKIAKEINICFEIPDARDPAYAGLYMICRVKQIYAAIKAIRESLSEKYGDDAKRVFMLIDFEHIATQGFDPLDEIKTISQEKTDVGEYVISCHVTKPQPLHHHIQIDIGDVEVYKVLYYLRTAGLGRKHTTYLIYERGGEQDPFKQSVTAIRLMVDQLMLETKPEELINKPEFFGVKGRTPGSFERQWTIIQEHAYDPIEGLTMIPEEKHSFLGKAGSDKIGAEKWKGEELS